MAGTRFLTFPGQGGDWVVVDLTRNAKAVASCRDEQGAELIAALMNGDLTALSSASDDTVARCREAIHGALRTLRPRGRPSVGVDTFPQL
jgi:hypothetical protein